MDPIDRAWHAHRVRVVAAIAARTRDLDMAEDVVQDAFVEAAARWPLEGAPAASAAWLFTVAWRRAVDVLRRATRAETMRAQLAPPPTQQPEPFEATVDDDVLGLVLSCSHPALDATSRLALTLRHVAGLRPREIAAAFLTTEAAMIKRLTRARMKMRASGIGFSLPEGDTLLARLDDARDVILLIFNEGYLAHDAGPPLRAELRAHAIRLARALREMRPEETETRALLALCLFHDARSAARYRDGKLVAFEEQDRAYWDASQLAEARRLLASIASAPPGPYALMAAIAALHTAPGECAPVWPRVAELYTLLLRQAPSGVVALNHAYAVGRATGAREGLRLLEPLLADPQLTSYAPLYAAAADLLERDGDARAPAMRLQAAALAPEGAQRDAASAASVF